MPGGPPPGADPSRGVHPNFTYPCDNRAARPAGPAKKGCLTASTRSMHHSMTATGGPWRKCHAEARLQSAHKGHPRPALTVGVHGWAARMAVGRSPAGSWAGRQERHPSRSPRLCLCVHYARASGPRYTRAGRFEWCPKTWRFALTRARRMRCSPGRTPPRRYLASCSSRTALACVRRTPHHPPPGLRGRGGLHQPAHHGPFPRAHRSPHS